MSFAFLVWWTHRRTWAASFASLYRCSSSMCRFTIFSASSLALSHQKMSNLERICFVSESIYPSFSCNLSISSWRAMARACWFWWNTGGRRWAIFRERSGWNAQLFWIWRRASMISWGLRLLLNLRTEQDVNLDPEAIIEGQKLVGISRQGPFR